MPIPQCELSAAPTQVAIGGTSTLTWSTVNATGASIDQGVGPVSPVSGGSVPVTVTGNTTYTLTATGPGGTVTCTAAVTVPPPPDEIPVCTLVANPTAIQIGSSSTLTWTTQNSVSFVIDRGVGSVTPVSGGSRSVSPLLTTTYTGTATGTNGQTVTCAATITVTITPPPQIPVCTLVANPTTINPGGTSTLTWTTQNVTSAVIDQGIGNIAPVSGGSVSVSPSGTTTYTLTGTGTNNQTVTCAATVTVTTNPVPICTLSANPTTINRGDEATLTWTSSNVTSGSINEGIGNISPVAGGDVNVSPTSNTTYTATFTGPYGDVTCTAAVDIRSTTGGGGGGGGRRSPRVVLDSLKQPLEEPLSFVYLSETPYTGLDLGPWGTALYWLMLIGWSAAAAYLVLFNALPFAAARVKSFGGNVQQALKTEPSARVAHAPAHDTHTAHPSAPTPSRPEGYNQRDGFRSFAADEGLTIDDIVKGLSRQIEERSAPAVEAAPIYTERVAEQAAAPIAAAPKKVEHQPVSEDVRDFLAALLAGDRDTVFGMIRNLARAGEDTELFVSNAACALDDAYRSCIDGTTCHPDIAELTNGCHPSFLERIVSSLTTAVDGSYSSGITGVKMALTRALGVVAG
ncbi:hypothetical protein KKD81_02790 [Patescibacteria group bacterium]|nr:hypothetical protein [Patescibacteria group bacterium]